jgi:hypothetical protein
MRNAPNIDDALRHAIQNYRTARRIRAVCISAETGDSAYLAERDRRDRELVRCLFLLRCLHRQHLRRVGIAALTSRPERWTGVYHAPQQPVTTDADGRPVFDADFEGSHNH